MFESPDSLRYFALEVAEQLKADGHVDESSALEEGANMVCTTGWEWLGELGVSVENVLKSKSLPPTILEKLNFILKTTKSSNPYG